MAFKYADGSMIAINCTKVQNEIARNMSEKSELDWLICTADALPATGQGLLGAYRYLMDLFA